MSVCPKCHYQRTHKDAQVHPDLCPACGIAINKWRARTPTDAEPATGPTAPAATHNLSSRLREHFMWVPEPSPTDNLWGRALVSGLLGLWGLWFVVHGVDWEVIGGSFMHNINLPFHEFGHVLFMPFGRFMTILGGSLFQVMLPLILLCAFSFQQRDNHAASVMLWWCGQSLVDLAPYIADAPYRGLPLVGGAGEESHDWGNLLTQLGWLDQAQTLARASFGLGAVVMAASLWWAFCLLRKRHRLNHES
ncbi:hypothetical protein [Simiduia aestuariiviva]|uniref:Zinc ribbon domain-containing protein n=1 Tax=Simiduia aestuariiviva TaxID=1510459 RepID=A0A839UWN1_9GAMM|nr:hypothetical protein [Simiduia aestuariiviva]MBB3169735.1 hypothetical protein [Simiduia aestuariiviva]